MRHELVENKTIKYFKVFTVNGRLHSQTCKVLVSEMAAEILHYNLKTVKDLIDRWDAVGRGYKKYRYFLISENFNLGNLTN